MNWLDEKIADILHQWKNNQLSYGEAVRELVTLGWSVERANQYLADN